MSIFKLLPQDVLSIILQHLCLTDVLNLRQVCRLADTLISSDKQFWVHRLEDGLFKYGCLLPIPRPSLDSLSAPVLESWTRRLLGLKRAYTSSSGAAAVTVSLTNSLPPVTWVKLVRGRWCLAAVSNSTSSRLLLYDGLDGFESGPRAEARLPGPVMDGVLEDTSSEINIAVSIGTINPYIQIASLCTCHDGKVQFVLRNVVTSALCTRFIHGRLVGFAMLDGDDQHPHVADWTNGKIWSLNREGAGSDSPIEMFDGIFEQGICRAMAVWSNHIITVFGTLVKVFQMPHLECDESPALITALFLDLKYPVSEVYFLSAESNRHFGERRVPVDPTASLFLIIRDTHCMFGVLELKADLSMKVNCHGLIWQPSYKTRLMCPRDKDIPYVSCLGSTGSAFCYCTINSSEHIQIPKFHVALIKSSFLSDHETMCKPVMVSTDGFPMLHEYPCVDFDDARGVVLIGNQKGELGLIEFEGGGVSERCGIEDDLPYRGRETYPKVGQAPTDGLDLGLFYKWHFQSPLPQPFADDPFIEVPDPVIDDFIRKYCTPDANQTPPEGWSNNWRRYKYLYQWLVPYLFWGESDTMGLRRPVTRHLRIAYHIYGCPIPLLYHEDFHYVIFRVGSRSYYVKFDIPQDGMIASIRRIYLPPKQISLGQVPDNIIYDHLSLETVTFVDKAMALQGTHKRAVMGLIEFSIKAGLVAMNDHHSHWSQDKWDYLKILWDDYTKHTGDLCYSYGEILEEWLKSKRILECPGEFQAFVIDG